MAGLEWIAHFKEFQSSLEQVVWTIYYEQFQVNTKFIFCMVKSVVFDFGAQMDLFTSITHQMDLWKCNKIIKLFVISSRRASIKYLILLLVNIQKMPSFSNGICIRFVRKAYQKWYLWNKFRAVILIKFYRFDIRCTTQFIHKNYRLIFYQSRTTNKKWMWILSEFKARDIVWCFF